MPNLERPNRQTIRVQSWDYSSNATYFVTLVAHERQHLFGEIIDGAMQINSYGQIVVDEWQRSAAIRQELALDEWVIMPNHLHGIVWVQLANAEERARSRAPLPIKTSEHGIRIAPKSLGAFINAFKGAVTTRINTLRDTRGQPIWQRNYYERIVRNKPELLATQNYIQANAANWAGDAENSMLPI